MSAQITKLVIINKQIGETPLEALIRYSSAHPELKDIPMTYAGRLDPMAEGLLIILVGDECKNKEKYLSLDKEYEVEIVFGISTDTYDALGLVNSADLLANELQKTDLDRVVNSFSKYTGKSKQKYPPYSSKTVGGEQLHTLARRNELPANMPEKEVEIYSIDILKRAEISASELLKRIEIGIQRVKGDFRQEEILTRWREVLGLREGNNSPARNSGTKFQTLKIKVSCSSGTYMRSLADKIGQDLKVGAFALSIKRTKIGKL